MKRGKRLRIWIFLIGMFLLNLSLIYLVSAECNHIIISMQNCNENGEIKYSYRADWTGNPPIPIDCVDGTGVMQCRESSLPFFNSFNLVLALILIIGVYFLLGRMKYSYF